VVIGDSKSYAQIYQSFMMAEPQRNGAILTQATGGITAEGMASEIDADIAAIVAKGGSDPAWAQVNLGTNNVYPLDEASYKAAMGYIIEALHTQWPDIKIFVPLIWRRDVPAACDTVDGWIGDIVSTYSAYAYVGHDERVWLKGGDNGATMTSDGIHYSLAGDAEAASQWDTVLGAIGY
jgi:hypothetical protein